MILFGNDHQVLDLCYKICFSIVILLLTLWNHVVMYMCVKDIRGIDFASLTEFSIVIWNCSDSMIFFAFQFKVHYLRTVCKIWTCTYILSLLFVFFLILLAKLFCRCRHLQFYIFKYILKMEKKRKKIK
jgi:hypothetical protein